MLNKVEGTPAIVDKINYNVSIQLPDDSSTRDYAACPRVEPTSRQKYSASARVGWRAIEADDRKALSRCPADAC